MQATFTVLLYTYCVLTYKIRDAMLHTCLEISTTEHNESYVRVGMSRLELYGFVLWIIIRNREVGYMCSD